PTANTGGNLPPQPVPETTGSTGIPALDGSQFVANPGPSSTPSMPYNPGSGFNVSIPQVGNNFQLPSASTSGKTVQDYLNSLLDENGSYLQNAARRGLEVAGSRGLLNSSIAAGTSTRAALEAAMPILGEIMSLHNNREGMAFQQSENQLNRQLQERLQALGFSFEDAQNAANRALQMTMNRENNAIHGEETALPQCDGVNMRLLAIA